ncbi:hypothetical protein JCM16303_005122 [Sporobolomyces ruberrimus]
MDPPSLPLDILHYLIEVTLPSSLSPIPLTRTLLSLSLVSHSFLLIAQPILYRSPFLSFDPPDTTPPGRTYSRIARLIETLERKDQLRGNVKSLEYLGQWSTRCLSEGVPNRKEVSKIMIKLLGTVLSSSPQRGREETKRQQLKILSFPFITHSDKEEFLRILAITPETSTENGGGGGSIEEIRFGEGGAYESSQDPWIINLDSNVREEWGTARFTIRDFQRLSKRRKKGLFGNVKRFRLMARLRVEDPLEEDDPLRAYPEEEEEEDTTLDIDNKDDDDDFLEEEEEEGEERFDFSLTHFTLDLVRNSKLSFPYLSRLVHSSRHTLTSLSIKEHQFDSPPTLYRFIRTFGKNLKRLETDSSNQFDDNDEFLKVIGDSCKELKWLRVGSAVKRPLVESLETISIGTRLEKLEYLEFSNCYSPRLISTLLPPTPLVANSFTISDEEKEQVEGLVRLSQALFSFRSLRKFVVGPQHTSVERGYEQERNVARYLRELDGTVEESRGGEGRARRVLRTDVSYWRWVVELREE